MTQRTMMGLASYLGSTPLTLLVRCPCGRRNYFNREEWSWLEVAFCVRCRHAILHADLRVITRAEGERMLTEQTIYEGELKAQRLLEGVMRHFLSEFHQEPLWKWPQPVQRMARAAQVNLQLAELARDRQGAQPTVPLEELPQYVKQFLEMPGEEAQELSAEQVRLLSLFSRLSDQGQAHLLDWIGQEVADSDDEETEGPEL